MKYIEYAEKLADDSFFDEYIDESFWNHDFKTEKCLDMLEKEAKKNNISLTDKEDFDYDDFFFNLYKTIEKGLS